MKQGQYFSLPKWENRYDLKDRTGELAERIIEQWLLPLADANPGMLDMLKERNQQPYRELLPWSGEFIGKHLTSCVELYMLTGNKRLKTGIEGLVEEVKSLQEEDGYIGPWADPYQLTGHAPNSKYHMGLEEEPIPVWDAWDFYHMMYGLICWYRAERQETAIEISRKLADLLVETFLEKGRPLSSMGTPETNLAPVHSLALLYKVTGEERYLSMAEKIVEEFSLPGGVNYMELALEGKDYYQMPVPRWEGLHSIMGLAALYEITGKPEYGEAFRKLWWSMVRTDRHNTGGVTSGEAACGNPWDGRAIETCCTVAWMAMTVEMLKLEMKSIYADELELSFYNGGMGAISPSGRWCTYNTPMEGVRIPAFREIDFQIRPGTPELNCCSVNAPRILGLLSQWACIQKDGELFVNYYGNYVTELSVKGKNVRLTQKSNYPLDGRILLQVETEEDMDMAFYLRIPAWSVETLVKAGKRSELVKGGTYFKIDGVGAGVKEIELSLDMRLHVQKGEREQEHKVSIYYGPILLACDEAVYPGKEDVCFDLDHMEIRGIRAGGKKHWLLLDVGDRNGNPVTFCDFRSAGYGGRPYRTWFSVEHMEADTF